MLLRLFTLLSFGLLCLGCLSFQAHGKDLPEPWAVEWQRNMELVVSWQLPYVWGGESKEEGGYDCSGFIQATSPAMCRKRRSTSSRMERGLDGWTNRPTNAWEIKRLSLIFIDGHVLAAVIRDGVFQVAHSRSSKGPVIEPFPDGVRRQGPRFKILRIEEKGEGNAVESKR